MTEENKSDILEEIKELGQILPSEKFENPIHCLPIIGLIEGHNLVSSQAKSSKYEHIIPLLVSLHEDPKIKGILVILNTSGGDVESGLAIAELLASFKKPVVSLVLGGGHSIGVPLAVSSDYSFIAPTATMTVHPVRMNGTVIGSPQTYDYIEMMQDRINHFILTNSKINEEKLKELMYNSNQLIRDIGTILVGKEAVDIGLIDEVAGLDLSIAKLKQLL